MTSCSSKIKFCRAAILSPFMMEKQQPGPHPSSSRSQCTPGWSPYAVQNKRRTSTCPQGSSTCPQGSPWGCVHHERCTAAPFARDKPWGRNRAPLLHRWHALMQCPGSNTVFNLCYRVSLKQIFTKSSLPHVSARNAKI